MRNPQIAVLLPCYNEELTIAEVVQSFRRALPDSTVYVYDNASTDRTAACARNAGAVVAVEPRRGKGQVVRRMFADIEADIYILADGDGTYDSRYAPRLIEKLIADNLDMIVGTRQETGGQDESEAYRRGHRLGNMLFNRFVSLLFSKQFSDIFSGYRVFSRRFVKSFPSLSRGFEIETEFTIHSLDLRLPVAEVATPYKARPEGSESKLNSFADGFRILGTIFMLLKETKPIQFFSAIFAALAALSIALAVPLFVSYLETGLVPRIPTAVLTTGIMLVGVVCFISGLILDSVSRGRREIKILHYLGLPSIRELLQSDEKKSTA
jgi:glycosyltransferase involved in cell wall biosynthesis